MSWKLSDFEGSKKEAESNALVCEKGTVIETSTSYMLTLSSINTVFTHSYNGLPFKSLRNSTYYSNANMNALTALLSISFSIENIQIYSSVCDTELSAMNIYQWI